MPRWHGAAGLPLVFDPTESAVLVKDERTAQETEQFHAGKRPGQDCTETADRRFEQRRRSAWLLGPCEFSVNVALATTMATTIPPGNSVIGPTKLETERPFIIVSPLSR